MAEKELTFGEWQKTVPETIRSEKFWSLIAYQKVFTFISFFGKIRKNGERMNVDKFYQSKSSEVLTLFARTLKKASDVDLERC